MFTTFKVLSLVTTLFAFSSKNPPLKKAPPKQKELSFAEKILLKHPSFDKAALLQALTFYKENKRVFKTKLCLAQDNINNRKKIRNHSCLIVADYTKEKTKPRLLFINPSTGESEIFYTAHGKGSNKPTERETGVRALRFSNKSGSNMTSLGFYLTDNLYTSYKDTFGPGPHNGLKLDGLNCSNNNARMRYIVLHTAQYVPTLKSKKPTVGNSEGCITLPKERKDVLKKCEKGALVYAYKKEKT